MTKSEKFEIIREMRERKDPLLTVDMLCEIAGVSPSGYYNWRASAEAREKRERADQEDYGLILQAYNQRGYAKGARGIYMTMLHWDPPVIMNLKKIRRLMKKYGLRCPYRQENPYKKMMRALQTDRVAPNLVNRNFTQAGPRKVLLTDITYLPWKDGFLYLCTLLDACTRQVLGWSLSNSLQVDFVLDALRSALKKYPEIRDSQALIHSDQGSHYTSVAFRDLLADKGLTQSMSRRGNCWDNAPQESFFGHMKDEYDIKGCQTEKEARGLVGDWLSYYNSQRYQWGLERLSPDEYYDYLTTGVNPIAGVKGTSKSDKTQ